jgi:cell division protein FtsL
LTVRIATFLKGGDFVSGKRKIQKKGLRISHVFVVLLVIYLVTVMNHQRQLMNSLEEKREVLESEIVQLEDKIEDLNDQIEKSGTLEFVERIARDELGMVKPREIIYIDKSSPEYNMDSVFDKDK